MPELFDFAPFRTTEQSMLDLTKHLTLADLRGYTNAMADTVREIIATATDEDVVFLPDDPSARDIVTDETDAWTLGHVIVHITASSEESAALALMLARNAAIPVDVRSRYETYWETIKTIGQVIDRVEDSRRICLAMLDAWPNPPHLDAMVDSARVGKINAVVRFMLGLKHADDHIAQLREIMQQSKAAQAIA